MKPSYHNLQLVLIDKRPQEYKKGTVLVFRINEAQGYIIKRVIAVGGETVLIHEGVLYVNGSPIGDMPFIQVPGRAAEELKIKKGYYFVLGDNVNQSIDSRSDEIGDVSQTQIIGRILLP